MTPGVAPTPPSARVLDRLLNGSRTFIERSERGGPMVVASLIGLVTGLGAVAFTLLIEGVHWLVFEMVIDGWLGFLPGWRILLAPALGGLLAGPLVMRLAPETRGAGVAEVLVAVEADDGRMRKRVAPAKAIAAALTIGSGGSSGREGPIVQIGAAVGSVVGQALRLSTENVQLLLASGAAAGIAATFNAPIAGVFFALEVVLRRFNARNFSVVVLASVVATVTAVGLRGDQPYLPVPHYELVSVTEIPLYALLGVLAGLVSIAFIRTLSWTDDRFAERHVPPQVLMPAVGGLMVGSLALIDRNVLGEGQAGMSLALAGDGTMGLLAMLLVLKLVATSITVGSGGSGGVFAPSLFIGAMLGGAYGAAAHGLLPETTATAGAYATVGMAALVAGTARSPITAVLILFELTRDYSIILPMMTAVGTATVVSQWLSPVTIFTYRLARRGVVIEEEPAPADVMQTLHVGDAMTPTLLTAGPEAPLDEVARLLSAADHESVVLVLNDAGELTGIVTNTDLNEALSVSEQQTAGDICSTDVRSVFPDQTLREALAVFGGRSMSSLPVMLRERPRVPCGLLRRSDITNAYASRLDERDAVRRRGRLARATGDDVRYLELRVQAGTSLDGRALAELRLTSDAVVVAIRRDGATLIPRGGTTLRAGDRVTVIAALPAVEEVRAAFEARPSTAARTSDAATEP